MRNKYFLIVICLLFFSQVHAQYRVQIKKTLGKQEVLGLSSAPGRELILLRSLPYFIAEYDKLSDIQFEEWIVSEENMKQFDLKGLNFKSTNSFDLIQQQIETKTLIEQGPKENRINLTILGDGYTLAEKNKFFSDADNLVKGLFTDAVFKSYLPLFNVYAVFVPSSASGIGDGAPAGTAFKLYRTPKGSKRAIYPGDESAIESALKYSPATDYPIIIANDEYYGGLGGRYAITTSSKLSGHIVLRHELGHNFGEVGEEYDNGSAYFGANNSRSSVVPWSQWVEGKLKTYESKLVSGNYVWQNLSNKKYQSKFRTDFFPNGFLYGTISSVGWDTAQDVSLKINNDELKLDGNFNQDRNFYEIEPIKNFPSGEHIFTAEEKIKDGNNVLGFATLFVAPSDYDFTPNKVAAFSTFNEFGSKSYRPTHSSCLMRDMRVNYFCDVDKENIWHKLLSRLRLIDELKVSQKGKEKFYSLKTIPLDGITVEWYKIEKNNQIHMPDLKNKMEWSTQDLNGTYHARVKFITPEVRKYTSAFQDQTGAKK
jgi:hypothetical protein